MVILQACESIVLMKGLCSNIAARCFVISRLHVLGLGRKSGKGYLRDFRINCPKSGSRHAVQTLEELFSILEEWKECKQVDFEIVEKLPRCLSLHAIAVINVHGPRMYGPRPVNSMPYQTHFKIPAPHPLDGSQTTRWPLPSPGASPL